MGYGAGSLECTCRSCYKLHLSAPHGPRFSVFGEGGGQKFPGGSDHLRRPSISGVYPGREGLSARSVEFSDFSARYDAPGSVGFQNW